MTATRSEAPPTAGTTGEGAVEQAYRDHGRAVFRMAAQIVGPAQAEDITQDVFVHLWSHPDAFDPRRGRLRAYLVAIAHHRAVDAARSESSRQGRQLRSADRSRPGHVRGADEEALAAGDAQRIAAAIATLPPGERAALLVTVYGQCTYRETAQLLAEPEGTTKSRIRSGLGRLRVTLADLAPPAST